MAETTYQTAEDCLFCKLVAGKIPSQTVYEDDSCVAFKDINPQAPGHLLLIPKHHMENLNDTLDSKSASQATTELLHKAAEIAKKQDFCSSGYRLVINNGAGAGQEVFHLHLHILSGRPFSWPPG